MQAMIAEARSKAWARAIALRERALAALAHQDDPSIRAWLELEIGRVMRNAGRIADSIPHLERAFAYYDEHRADLYVTATSQFWLAKSLYETRRDRPRAVKLARAALADALEVKSGMNLDIHRKQIADWLAAHP